MELAQRLSLIFVRQTHIATSLERSSLSESNAHCDTMGDRKMTMLRRADSGVSHITGVSELPPATGVTAAQKFTEVYGGV